MTYFQTRNSEAKAAPQDQILFEMGVMYATGRDCDINVIEAHKWLNIAAIRGNEEAAIMRTELAATMSKSELAAALREAREWMTMH